MSKLRIAQLIAALAVAAAIPVALALAATSSPTVSTSPATNVSGSGATLNGSVNPNGQQTSYAFQWGPTNGYGHETALTSAGAGSSPSSVNAILTGLASGTVYHFRIIAMSPAGATSVGSDETFTTTGTAPAPSPSPTANTGSASNVGQAGATVSGAVSSGGQATQYYFEYGPSASYGFETQPKDAASDATNAPVNADLSGLLSSTTYHYRLVAVNAGGTALGHDQTFTTTTPPTASTGGASHVRSTSTVVTGTVNPRGQQTTYYFQYGTSTAYGEQTSPAGAGSGTSDVGVHAFIGGLAPNTSYHYRLVATSPGGTSYGGDNTVVVGAASHVAFLGREGFVSPGRVIGVEAGCFGGTTNCTGHVSLIHDGVVIGQRDFNIAPDSGGFQNMQISGQGEQMLRTYNHVFHLLPVTVSVTESDGRKTSEVMHLSRWVWN